MKDWWDRNPTLIVYNNLNVVDEKISKEELNAINTYFKIFYEDIRENFKNLGSNTYIYEEHKELFKKEFHVPFGIILNPVAIGDFPYPNSFEGFEEFLRENLPEVFPPFAIEIGKNTLNLSPSPHPNFINVIFIHDEKELIFNLPYDKKILLFRMFMAKLGAFKNIIIPYKLKNNDIYVNGFILSTLEGGCPVLKDTKELSKRLRVFGSCKEVGGHRKRNDVIPYDKWENSIGVRSIINLGRYLGEKGLLSSPVEINSLVKNEKLGKFISMILSYSRQAEGAFMSYDYELKLFVVTASGRFNVDKSNLSPKDLVPVIPTEEGIVEVFNIENIEVKGPSVEAEEFTLPLKELGQDIPEILGIVHLHRGIDYFDDEKIIYVPQDIEKYPPVGCGVDLMHEMSRYAIFYAINERKIHPEKKIAIFSVPNHGTNIYCFRDEKSLSNPFIYFLKFLEEGKIKFRFDVPQV
ncbi:MAG: hypothetical protein CBR30_06990 [Dictyoglomus sp. NZ13-RE01]|nr:MAG: hypothetical protein CBR30_06990 [Dictyoglomus sp. NZ13-RE01]